jgi:hypothetical protein
MSPVTKRTIAHVLTTGVVVAALVGCATTTGSASPAAATQPAAQSAAQSAAESAARPAPGTASTAGCGGDLPAAAGSVEVAARLVDGRVEPAPQRVDVALGATVVLRVEVDTPAEVHVHGYDRAAVAAPGAPACLEVVTDVPGVFEVEAHPDTLLLQLAVR